MPARDIRATAERYIALIGLAGFERRFPRELSGGMKQRVALARTFAYEPAILLLDEPFGALDAQTREIMQDELLRLWRTTGKTVVMVTHDVNEAVYLSNRVCVMSQRPGRIVKEFATLGVKTSTYTAFTCNAWRGFASIPCATVTDIIAEVMPGEGKAIVLLAHYDSVPAGPGASAGRHPPGLRRGPGSGSCESCR